MNTGSIANLSIIDYLKRIGEERLIIDELEGQWDLTYPEAAKLLLGRLRASGIFKTHVGRGFIASLERRVAADKQDDRLILMLITLPVAAVLLCAGLIVMPVFFPKTPKASLSLAVSQVSALDDEGITSPLQSVIRLDSQC